MEYVFYSIVAVFLAWFGYGLVRMIIAAIKLGIQQADRLEREFGTDIAAAARYTLTGRDARHDG